MTTRDISTRHLRYFLAAAQSGQFSLAAHAVHVSQTAITTTIGRLESMLGVKLFERRPHGVALTAEGRHFLEHAQAVLSTLRDATRAPTMHTYDISGTVRIAATGTVMGYFLAPYLARFRRTHPKIELKLVEMIRPALEDRLHRVDNDIDVVIAVSSNLSRKEGLVIDTLVRSRRQLWTSTDHPLCLASEVSLKEISEYPLVKLTVDESGESASRYWRKQHRAPNVLLETESMEAVRSFVGLGLGVTILADLVFRPWTLDGRKIETRPITDVVPPMELGIVRNMNHEESPAAQALNRFLKDACSIAHF
ncbi:LysR substrate-binding domain-containing protein [Caballeronia glathei]|uniref:LysR family transcriptional regulator n=1 Tax=Caballeronia glathei TaxID=60547 RepID=A0A069PKI5_9BURK|nr:LysR substrate-binding domain-containing protein [Caballeronia glathei]KDR37826.1 LysR family transcriptional regulator [Caballeronia glathei]